MNKNICTKGLNGRVVVKASIAVRLLVGGLLFSFLILGCSCQEVDGVGFKPAIQLTAEDASCTEAWLRLQVSDTVSQRTLTIKRDQQEILTINNVPSDTIIIDEGLLPNHTYKYSVRSMTVATVTTMDTTSHDFTWHIDTLGDYSSYLRDVVIINDTLVYAVGEIFKSDSTDIGTHAYGLARWNGTTWKYIKAPYRSFPTMPQKYPGGLEAIAAFGADKICVTPGNLIMWYDGENFSEEVFLYDQFTDIPPMGSITAFWGISPNQLWAVGFDGAIFFYNGVAWQKLEKVTPLHIFDIWGAFNKKKEGYEILAAGTNSSSLNRIILQINETAVSSITDYPISYSLRGVWFVSNRHYYVVGSGIYEKRELSDSIWKNQRLDITQRLTLSVHGNAINDVMIVGSYGEALHYNGISWKSYLTNGTGINGAYGTVRMKGNLVVAVGTVNDVACVAIGRR